MNALDEVLNYFFHSIMRGLSGVFQVAFDTSTSGVIMCLDFSIPLDLLQFTVAKVRPGLFDRWVCVKAVLAACMSWVAAEREAGDACGVLLAAPQVVFVCRHPSVGPAAPSNPVANTQRSDKKETGFVSKMAWSSPVIHQFDTINLSSRVKHLMVQVY